ncbi:MAG: hypothetical protein ACRCVX_15100 [Shewanella sp.]
MPWDIELYHPHTAQRIDSSSLVLETAIVHRHPGGGSIETNIVIYPKGPDVLRKLLRLTRDNVARSFGVVTSAPNPTQVDKMLTANVAGAKKRLFEIALDETYVEGGDVGEMVNTVFNNPKNIPEGFTFSNVVPRFGFQLGDRITKRSEYVGDFLDAMAQALPGFVVPTDATEYQNLIGAFPEMEQYQPGEIVLGAIWDVLPNGQIIFGRFDTTNTTLVENDNCQIIEQDMVEGEKIVTIIRWTIDAINLYGHMLGVGYRSTLPSDPIQSSALEPIRRIDFYAETEIENDRFIGLSKYTGVGEAIFYDAVNDALVAEYGRAYDVYNLQTYEPVFRKQTGNIFWDVLFGDISGSNLNDIQNSVPVNITPNIDGFFTMYMNIDDVANYEGFYIDAPQCEVSWFLLHSRANLANEYCFQVPPERYIESGFAYQEATKLILFSKRELQNQIRDNDISGAARLSVTLKLSEPENIGNFYEAEIFNDLPTLFRFMPGTVFEHTLKVATSLRNIEITAFVALSYPALKIPVAVDWQSRLYRNGVLIATTTSSRFALIHDFLANDVVQIQSDVPSSVYCEFSIRLHSYVQVRIPNGVILHGVKNVNITDPPVEIVQAPFASPVDEIEFFPHTIENQSIWLASYYGEGTSFTVRLHAKPTLQRTINEAFLIRKNENYLRRMAQNLYKVPHKDNMTIVCDEFVEPTRRINIPGRGDLFPTKFTDFLIDDQWNTVITIGQPENVDDEAMRVLLEERAKLEGSKLND